MATQLGDGMARLFKNVPKHLFVEVQLGDLRLRTKTASGARGKSRVAFGEDIVHCDYNGESEFIVRVYAHHKVRSFLGVRDVELGTGSLSLAATAATASGKCKIDTCSTAPVVDVPIKRRSRTGGTTGSVLYVQAGVVVLKYELLDSTTGYHATRMPESFNVGRLRGGECGKVADVPTYQRPSLLSRFPCCSCLAP